MPSLGVLPLLLSQLIAAHRGMVDREMFVGTKPTWLTMEIDTFKQFFISKILYGHIGELTIFVIYIIFGDNSKPDAKLEWILGSTISDCIVHNKFYWT